MTDQEREYWKAKRVHIIDELWHIEKMLGMPRTIPSKEERKRAKHLDVSDNPGGIETVKLVWQPVSEGTCLDCMQGDCEKARQGISHT